MLLVLADGVVWAYDPALCPRGCSGRGACLPFAQCGGWGCLSAAQQGGITVAAVALLVSTNDMVEDLVASIATMDLDAL
eukprot:gene37227-56245_t